MVSGDGDGDGDGDDGGDDDGGDVDSDDDGFLSLQVVHCYLDNEPIQFIYDPTPAVCFQLRRNFIVKIIVFTCCQHIFIVIIVIIVIITIEVKMVLILSTHYPGELPSWNPNTDDEGKNCL